MPLTLPNLDDVTWEQLNAEARALIPAYAPGWTNYNPADPGITLVELLAHFTEFLLYRANRIGDEQTVQFLRLLNGPQWQPSKPLVEEKRLALLALRKPLRAVTAADYETIAKAAAPPSSLPPSSSRPANSVARAKCIANRNLEAPDAAGYTGPAPGHISVVVLPRHGRAPNKSMLTQVKQALDAARLITTRIHVVPPRFVAFGIRVTLVLQTHASVNWVKDAAMNTLQDFFDPLRGNFDQKGWPFGHDIYISHLYQVLGNIPGVDYVTRSKVLQTHGQVEETVDELVLQSADLDRLRFNDRKELIAVDVHDEELVLLQMTPEDIVIETKARRP